MEFPLTVVKDKEKAKVYHAPDLQGWLEAGYKLESDTTKEKAPKAKEEKGLLG